MISAGAILRFLLPSQAECWYPISFVFGSATTNEKSHDLGLVAGITGATSQPVVNSAPGGYTASGGTLGMAL